MEKKKGVAKFRKGLLISLLAFIYLLSSNSGLIIIQPETWFSGLRKEYFMIDFRTIFAIDSDFYKPYGVFLEINFIVHKMSHFFFFGLLSWLFYWNFRKIKYAYLFSWLCVTTYGYIDELHQFSVPGRTGVFQDVIIDSLSALIWLLILYFLRKNKSTKANLKKEIIFVP